MRLLFLLLMLANVGFYAYAFVARDQRGADRQLSRLQVNPDKIRVVTDAPAGAAGAPKPTAPAATASSACLEWGVFAGSDVARADAAVSELGLPEAQVMRTVVDAGGYWVYIPPLKTRRDVDKQVAQLKSLGVGEFFIVQDATQWRNAISLGIFKSDDAAKARLAELQGKGVHGAVAGRRENLLKQIAYYVREPNDATVARLTALQQEFPGTQIKALACLPPGNT